MAFPSLPPRNLTYTVPFENGSVDSDQTRASPLERHGYGTVRNCSAPEDALSGD